MGTFLISAVALLAFVVRSGNEDAIVAGRLVPVQGMATVLAPVTGVVRWLDVDDGKRVVEGDTLALVARPRAMPEIGGLDIRIDPPF